MPITWMMARISSRLTPLVVASLPWVSDSCTLPSATICAAFFEKRLTGWFNFIRQGETITNRSTDWGAFTLNGLRARDVLTARTDASPTNAGFNWMSAQEMSISGHKPRPVRLSYASGPGREFHGPREVTNDLTLRTADVMRLVRMDKDFHDQAATKAAAVRPLTWVCT